MAGPAYHFVTDWRFEPASAAEVHAILRSPEDLPRWWPSVYLRVRVVDPGEPSGLGRVVELHTKGWLPYTLDWRFTVIAAEPPHRSVLEATGDLAGRGEWTLADRAGGCDVRYDWRVEASKPLLRRLSFALRPVFAANHRWAMERGEESLRLELARRRATSEAERARIPPPPGPTWPHGRR